MLNKVSIVIIGGPNPTPQPIGLWLEGPEYVLPPPPNNSDFGIFQEGPE